LLRVVRSLPQTVGLSDYTSTQRAGVFQPFTESEIPGITVKISDAAEAVIAEKKKATRLSPVNVCYVKITYMLQI
jgi:hypothetical protein